MLDLNYFQLSYTQIFIFNYLSEIVPYYLVSLLFFLVDYYKKPRCIYKFKYTIAKNQKVLFLKLFYLKF